eukprot:CAMPEP_0201570688 /NCGR_PEP_ID=MMETSP0190_2-20130828/13035_1 /ASSEMBLY_ACC=CAM_ASM_000263 /TAXON_ID=37353 /ORGANISM="Rosalina sp." /LENGTH=464 /DNA_ID=CAMNT_0047994473 /DNA_START=410 /DNA_END=1804 /DNA_ORIENTATION=-
MINDAAIAKQILSKSYAQDRDMTGTKASNRKNFNMLAAEDNTPSFIALNGKKWSTMRQLVHSKLVRVMNTKYVNDIMSDVIKNEFEPKLTKIINSDSNEWFCRESLSQLTFNIIFKANFGQNVGFADNPLCTQLAKDIVDVVGWDIAKRSVLLFMLPNLAPTVIPKSYFQPVYDIKKRINASLKKLIQQRNSMEKKQNGVEDVTFMDHTREMVDKEADEYTESQEIADIFLLFLAGTDTTSISTEWGLLLLSRQPEIQERVRNELISVLDKNGIDYKSDPVNVLYDIKLLLQLPLFRACIHEILRISCVARTGVPHASARDIPIKFKDGKQYTIPAGARIFYNVEGIHYNVNQTENWKNDKYGLNYQQICLENWLKDDSDFESGFKFYQNPSFITFGHGKRDCVGKQLAMKEMRVILGYLLLNYRFKVEDKYMEMDRIPCKGGVRGGVSKPLPQIPLIVEQMKY